MDNKVKKEIIEMLNEGMPVKSIAEKTGYNPKYIYNILHKEGITTEEIKSKVKNQNKLIGKKYNFIDGENGNLLFTGTQKEASKYFGVCPKTAWIYAHNGAKKIKAVVYKD